MEVATNQHILASSEALEKVSLAFAPSGHADGSVYVALCHFQHDGFLTPDLHGFPALPFDSVGLKEVETVPVVQELSTDALIDLATGWANEDDVHAIKSRQTHFFVDPSNSAPERPVRLMVSLNDPVASQINAALSNVSLLLGRRRLISSGPQAVSAPTLPAKASAADRHAEEQVADGERAFGWRSVAQKLREQAAGQGTPLQVDHIAPAFAPEDISQRAPAMRYIYNSVPQVRQAVDKMVAWTTSGMRVGGSGVSEEILRFSEELLDRTQIRKFLAHALRDAFVCGNGAISFGQNPATDLRLIDPDTIVGTDGPKQLEVIEGLNSRWESNCLHLRGADQINSQLGLSYLEPLVSTVIQRCMWIEVLITARAWDSSPSTPQSKQVQAFVRDSPSLAISQLEQCESNIGRVLGGVMRTFPEPPVDLYFEGQRAMAKAAPYLSLRGQGDSDAQV